MNVEFKPLTASLIPASRAFNARLRAHGAPPFLLPEEVASAGEPVSRQHYVAVDQSGEVRGGVLLVEQRGWLQNDSTLPLINIQSPLSEGLVDRRFSAVSLQMLKFVTSRSSYSYAVGMGHEQNALPRLLTAAGWSVSRIPFAFTVINSRRFLRQIRLSRNGPGKWLTRVASESGVSSLLLKGWRLVHPKPSVRAYSLELVPAWPNEMDIVWEGCRQHVSFSVLRDQQTLIEMYPATEARLRRFVLRLRGEIVGWSVGLVTKMTEDKNFGDLVVGTVLDGLAEKQHLSALLALTVDALSEMNSELILTNQTHQDWRVELRRLGFFAGPSNYLLALSKPLSSVLNSDASALERMHVNRGDGDGRIHL
jgi:hypothetical protein